MHSGSAQNHIQNASESHWFFIIYFVCLSHRHDGDFLDRRLIVPPSCSFTWIAEPLDVYAMGYLGDKYSPSSCTSSTATIESEELVRHYHRNQTQKRMYREEVDQPASFDKMHLHLGKSTCNVNAWSQPMLTYPTSFNRLASPRHPTHHVRLCLGPTHVLSAPPLAS